MRFFSTAFSSAGVIAAMRASSAMSQENVRRANE
jgi:hypothetical protein